MDKYIKLFVLYKFLIFNVNYIKKNSINNYNLLKMKLYIEFFTCYKYKINKFSFLHKNNQKKIKINFLIN